MHIAAIETIRLAAFPNLIRALWDSAAGFVPA
jgi:hypothetical protein